MHESRKEDLITSEILTEMTEEIFGEDIEIFENRIKSQSPYSKLKSWKLVHCIVKVKLFYFK